MRPYLHDRSAIPQRHCYALLVLKSDAPHGFPLSNKLPYKMAGLQIPHLDTPVATSAHDSRVVKLQACDAVVMRRKTVDGTEPLQ